MDVYKYCCNIIHQVQYRHAANWHLSISSLNKQPFWGIWRGRKMRWLLVYFSLMFLFLPLLLFPSFLPSSFLLPFFLPSFLPSFLLSFFLCVQSRTCQGWPNRLAARLANSHKSQKDTWISCIPSFNAFCITDELWWTCVDLRYVAKWWKTCINLRASLSPIEISAS